MNLEEFRKALSSDATEENAQLKRQLSDLQTEYHEKLSNGQLLSENLKKIFRILDEKSLSATNVGALIIRNVRKRFVKPGNTTNQKINRLCKS